MRFRLARGSPPPQEATDSRRMPLLHRHPRRAPIMRHFWIPCGPCRCGSRCAIADRRPGDGGTRQGSAPGLDKSWRAAAAPDRGRRPRLLLVCRRGRGGYSASHRFVLLAAETGAYRRFGTSVAPPRSVKFCSSAAALRGAGRPSAVAGVSVPTVLVFVLIDRVGRACDKLHAAARRYSSSRAKTLFKSKSSGPHNSPYEYWRLY